MQLKNTFLISALMTLACATGCAHNETSIPAKRPTDSLPSVEKDAPNSNYKPAFDGQTRIGGAKTGTPYSVVKIANKLGSPFAIVAMPDGRLMVTLKSGYMEIHDKSGALVKKITGLPPVEFAGQGGLLDVAFDPQFATNNMMYWSYSEKYAPGNLTAVAKGKLNEAAGIVENVTVIFRATPALKSNMHFGSRLVFDKEGFLFVSAGERSILDGRVQAQKLESHLGKVFRITTDGKAAPGNPYLNTPGAMPEIYSSGHRNPQGLTMNPATGDIWEAEFGPRGGDEVNLILPGKDYGWPTITYGIEYSGSKVGDGIQQKAGLEQPVYYWDPVISPSGICFYSGTAIPEWTDNLFLASLSGMHIDRLIIKNNKVVGEERLLADIKDRFRDVTYLDEMLFAITDNGDVYKIAKK